MKNNLLCGQIGAGIDFSDFTNDSGADIRLFIEEGKTVIFKNEKSAKMYASQQNTYYYVVFKMGKTTEFFAVPK